MTFAEGMVDVLEGSAALEAVLGTDVAMRLYPLRLPQDPPKDATGKLEPAIVFQRVSAPRRYTHDGGVMVRARWQYACWAGDYLTAQALGDVLVAELSGYRATLSSGERVDVVKIENDLDDFEPDTGRSRRLIDAVWHYEES